MGALFSFKLVAPILAVALMSGFALGVLHWNGDKAKCQYGKRWTSDRWYTGFAISKLEFRYRNLSYGCPNAEKYNPDEMKPLTETDLTNTGGLLP